MKKKRKALLIYPKVPRNTYWSFNYALKFVRKKSAMPPLGLITVASYFPESYDLRLVDLNIESLDEADIVWADAVFISAMIVQKGSFKEIVEVCNRLNKPVVAGGPYPTSSYKEISGVDHFVLGEIENIFDKFLDDFEKGSADRVYRSEERPCMMDSKVPRFDLLNIKAYSSMSIQYSRGCPFKCEFCDIWSVYGNKPRLKSHDKILSELNSLYSLGWRGPIFIVDDNFIGNKKRVKNELLPALLEWQKSYRFPYRFFTEASINIADDTELLTAMRNAGFDEIFIGIESPSAEALAETGKIQNIKSNMREAIRTVQRHGIEVMAGFIIGFDSDTDDIIDKQIEFIQESGIPQAMVGLLTALPGTKLHQRLAEEGRLLGAPNGNNTDCNAVNFRPNMGTEKLKNGYSRLMSSIYDKNMKNYFRRCSNLLERIGNTSLFSRDIRPREILALFLSIIRQPFTSYGHQYIRFLTKSIFRYHNLFSEAIRLSIIGHHFHRITQEMLKVQKVSALLDEKFELICKRIQAYSKATKENYAWKRNLFVEIINERRTIHKEIKSRIKKIHKDFREDINQKYLDVLNKIEILIMEFEHQKDHFYSNPNISH